VLFPATGHSFERIWIKFGVRYPSIPGMVMGIEFYKKIGGGQGARRKCRDLHKRPYKKYREPWAATGIHHTVMEGQ